ncbi:biotin carboxylase protein (plasmid) [Rhizobium etli bv. mimosae str. IE4771]|uniref:Biotin carboxylase protein n=1 Tax=Rhizobium etli bv. mimosae str. IE4771 TaxID=1432050 RepID=A0A060I8A6_RHIET|nr:acetyl-CoA carboxylase biotin carboxylase subunit family protein [Rhizobium sp. IE4771]AIC29964.1 biotin carboxylase protein [Rhizobium sp. IE4771]
MARSALILIEGHRGNGPLYVHAAQRLGLHPITLSTDPTQYSYLSAEGIEVRHVDTESLEALICECSQLRKSYDIVGITGFAGCDESVYLTMSRLCRHLALPGPNPTAIEGCYDKHVQRQLLAQAEVPMPAYRVATNARDVENAAEEIGLPLIIKPVVGSGSSGVRLCRDAGDLAQHVTYLLSGKHIWRSSPKILIEEFADGPHYSVDTMGSEVIAIGAAHFGQPPHFVLRESIFPALLTDEQHRLIVDVSLSCLRALNLGWGPANIELRWTRRGPVVIEVNPRLPGCCTPRLIQLSCGVDLVTEHIKLVVNDQLDVRSKRSHIAAARFLVPELDGVLDWIGGDSRAASEPGVAEVALYVKPKTPIVRRGDYLDSLGHVIVADSDRLQTETILRRAVDLIGWSITPFPRFESRSSL